MPDLFGHRRGARIVRVTGRAAGARYPNDAARRSRRFTVEQWIADAKKRSIPAIVNFVRALMHDIQGVRNAVIESWSNGQTEGQINRLKTLKRSMFGRTDIQLLRARMPPPGVHPARVALLVRTDLWLTFGAGTLTRQANVPGNQGYFQASRGQMRRTYRPRAGYIRLAKVR